MPNAERSERLARLLRRRAAQSGTTAGTPMLSTAQRRLLTMMDTDPTGRALTVGMAYDLAGRSRVDALVRALADLAAVHDALRCAVSVEDGEPRVEVRERLVSEPLVVPDGDWSATVDDAVRRPWDLASGDPVRFIVGARGNEASRLAIVAHHLWWDDACWAIATRDLDAILGGSTPPRRSVPAPRPAAAAPAPGDGREPVRCGPTGLVDATGWGPAEAVPLTVADPGRDGAGLAARCAASGIRPAALLLAAMSAAIPSGGAPVAVVMPVLLRDASDGASATFTYEGNSVICDLTTGPAADPVARAASELAEALESAATDISAIAAIRVGAPPEISLVVEETAPAGPLGAPGSPLRTGVTMEPLTVRASVLGDDLSVSVDYQPERVRPGVAHAFAARLGRALGALADGRDSRAADAPHEVPAGSATGVGPESPAGMIRAAAGHAPHAPAIRDRAETVDYARLVEEASGLAPALAALAGDDGAIATSVPRGRDAVVVLTAAIFAGVPITEISPRVPADRLRGMLDDARVRAVVAGDDVPEAVSEACGDDIPVVRRADIAHPGPGDPKDLPAPGGDDVACIVFTSGTTGRPKPVEVTHRGLARHADWALRGRLPGDRIRVLHAAPPGFDASIGEVVMTLSAGGELVCVEPGGEFDVRGLLEAVRKHEPTVLHGVPAIVEGILREAESTPGEALAPVAWVLSGGDRLPATLAARLRRLAPRARIANCYGPTETTLAATMGVVDADFRGRDVPVGHPRPELTAEILDEELNPVPDGEIGELYLSGDGIARGYRGMPGETAARFVAAPDGRRRYRTGDRASMGPDGIICHGRVDDQMKIRGVRFEPGDVEAALRRHPAVEAAVAVVADGGIRAFVVAGGRRGDCPDVRAHAAGLLPEAIVPAVVEAVDRIPLTRNGKPDRAALARRDITAVPAPGADGATGLVASVMAGCLDGRDPGPDGSFFAHGGDSLAAMELVRRLADAGVAVSLRDVIDNPTPRGLAAAAIGRSPGRGDSGKSATARGDGASVHTADAPAGPGDAPMTPAQHRMWVIDQVTDDAYRIVVPVVLRGPRDDRALASAVADVVAAHEGLRTSFPSGDGGPVQRVHAEGPGLIRTDCAPADVAARMRDIRSTRWNLAEGVPARLECLVTGPTRAVLVIAVHHILADHAALEILVDDLVAAYAARTGGTGWSPTGIVQPRALAAAAAARQAGAAHGEGIAWWRGTLAGYADLPEPAAADPGPRRASIWTAMTWSSACPP